MPLPPGLALNPLTGVISGTPTEAGTYSFTLRVRDSQGALQDIPQSITVAAYTPPSLSGTLAGFANRTVSYSSGFAVADGTAPYTWSISSGALPTGLSINASTGVISGTPSDTSYTDRNITVRVVDAAGSSAQRSATIRYADVMALSGTLGAGVQGTAYSSSFTRSGGHSPFTFTLQAGTLPAGLSLNSTTGVISGTPTAVTSNAITIRVTDAAGAIADRSQTLVVNSSYVALSFSGSVASNTQDVETLSAFSITPSYSGVTLSGGTTPVTYSWARQSGSTAISAGSPTSFATSFVGNVSPGASVSAVFRLTATDGISSATLDVTITVTNVYVTLAASASGFPLATRTVPYGITVGRTGGKNPYTFAVISGTLPTGITLNSATGQLSGTPTDTSYTSRSLTFRVTDALGATADASTTLVYRNFPILTLAFPPAMRTRAYSTITLAPSNTHTPGTFEFLSGTLPTGISFTGGVSATLSGTPTDTSYTDRTIAFRFTDAAGNVAEDDAVLTYRDNLAIAGTFPAGNVGVSYSSTALSASGGYGTNVWSVASGSLPAGLSLNSSTGALTGTPTTAGSSSFTVRVTDAQGFTADSAQSVSIAAALTASLSNESISDTTSAPTTALARYRLTAAGGIEEETSLGTSSIGTWLTSGSASDAEVRATLNSGSLQVSSATGSWLDFSVARAWSCRRDSAGINAAQITVEIRNKNTLSVIATATIDLFAQQT